MRLNAVPPSSVAQPEVRLDVGSVVATRAIGSQGGGASPAGLQGPAAEQGAPAPAVAPAVERRERSRRSDDRRKQKLPILLEMRVASRRTGRRRADDEAPPSVDTKA